MTDTLEKEEMIDEAYLERVVRLKKNRDELTRTTTALKGWTHPADVTITLQENGQVLRLKVDKERLQTFFVVENNRIEEELRSLGFLREVKAND